MEIAPSNWSILDVLTWLESLELPQYHAKFEELRIDGPLLLEITESDLLNDFGIPVRLHRYKIAEAVKKLKSDLVVQPDRQIQQEEEKFDWSSMTLKMVEGLSKNKEFEIAQAGATIGRHSGSNDFVINESFVSRKHCEIKYNENCNQFVLKDVGSTTGTFLMAKKRLKAKIGLMFQMGSSEFKVENVKFTPYGVPFSLTFVGFEGPVKGKEFVLDRNGGVIGRDIEHKISIPEDSQLSLKHGRVFFENSMFYIEDLGSTNKTWIRISAESEKSDDVAIYIDDVIKIGSSVLQVVKSEVILDRVISDEETACKICFTYEPNTLCYPCGHIFCYGCLKKCSACPICRKEITDKVRVYK